MDRTSTLLFIAGLLALYGGYSVFKGVRSIRAPRQYQGVKMYWEERPGGMLTDDPPGWAAIFIHRIALISIGIASIVVILRAESAVAGSYDPIRSLGWLADMALYGAVGMTAFAWGFSFFGPLAEQTGGNHHYAVSEQGLLIGGQVFPWNTFSRFQMDTQHNRIYIWSAALPGTAAMVAALPTSSDTIKLAGILREHIQEADPFSRREWGGLAFPALMMVLCFPFVLAAWMFTRAPTTLALVSNGLLMWLLLPFGGMLINRLIYGGKGRPVSSGQ